MPSHALTRRRKRQPVSTGLRLGLLASLISLVTVLLLATAAVVLRLGARLPDVGRVETAFGLLGAESYRPMLVLDRTGQSVLYRHLNPAAESRRWAEVDQLPQYVIEAMIAAQDPEYWTGSGLRAFSSLDPTEDSIPERLVRSSVLPPISGELLDGMSAALLAAELESRYPKERILGWYLNSADFGRAAYGIDAAALVYFDKHADQLTRAEAALLAGLASDTRLDPARQPGAARALRQRVLLAMPSLSELEARRAIAQPLGVRPNDGWDRPDWVDYLLSQLERSIGQWAVGRSGLRVTSTLDEELLDQSACAAETHVARLQGQDSEATQLARGQRTCVAAALLPALRPGDAGVRHGVEDWALVVLDPAAGELLAMHGPASTPQSAGPIAQPFLYLTAFSQGSAPASMVLDLGDSPAESQGPVRMRIALANLYNGAAERVLDSVGADAHERTLRQVGLAPNGEPGQLTPLQVSAAYGVLATQGLRAGYGPDGQPSALLQVREDDGHLLYKYAPHEQPIVSPQLAHLVIDVLTDESARWPTLGQGNLLEVGFPAGVLAGGSAEADSNWTVGFTPHHVVGVWLGGSPLRQVDRLNGAASIWNAVIRFASADQERRGWEPPPGLSSIEVCDPSGLLPTSYCPSVVRELFAPGSEPTHFDDLYRPVRINRETGKLATLFTPLESVEERVYFVPPPEAAEWARAVGLELPPEEFDPLPDEVPSWPGVQIRFPDPFQILGDEVAILGEAAPQEFDYYRLQYGQGLNPAQWVQIGTDRSRRVVNGRLGTWITEGLNGLYTLQLLVILEDGQVRTAAVPVTLDNEPPSVEWVRPLQSERFSLRQAPSIPLQAEVTDAVGVQRVEFTVDGLRVATLFEAPYRFEWSPARTGVFELGLRAYDQAGNRGEAKPLVLTVAP